MMLLVFYVYENLTSIYVYTERNIYLLYRYPLLILDYSQIPKVYSTIYIDFNYTLHLLAKYLLFLTV